MLGYLAVGSQLCPRQQARSFGALFAKLVREDGYGDNILNGHATSPGSIAFFDCERPTLLSPPDQLHDELVSALFTRSVSLTQARLPPDRLAFASLLMLSMGHLEQLGTPASPIPLSAAEGAAFRHALNVSVGRYW